MILISGPDVMLDGGLQAARSRGNKVLLLCRKRKPDRQPPCVECCRVLVISTVGAFIVLAGLYIYYFGLPF